jgi:glucokinase-like ROK family protein
MNPLLDNLHRRLIVSCQAFPNDPMEDTDTLRRVARSAVLGGASGLRLNSPEHVQAVRKDTRLPIIAIQKSYVDGHLRITPDFASASMLAAAGADIIALDCTDRPHTHGEPWREIVQRIHNELGVLVMADIATLREGVAAAEAGVDIVAPTLHGYTEDTKETPGFHPELIRLLASETGKPIIAEGNVNTPLLARIALESGAWCVVVGSAITRPGTITASFIEEMHRARFQGSCYVLGIDVGGTAVKAAIVKSDGTILHSFDTPTVASEGRAAIAEALATATTETIRAANDLGVTLQAVGVASAGAIDSSSGTVFAATENLPGWTGFDIRAHLSTLTALPVFVENDAHAAALAELSFGVARGLSDFVAITVGTGIGGGVVVAGKLLRGRYGFAGTIGHQTIVVDGKPCNCGRRGCLEAYVSSASLIDTYSQLTFAESKKSAEPVDARRISLLAASGDLAALEAYRVLADYLAEGIANICNFFDPQAIVLSGGLVEGRDGFERQVEERVQALLHFGSKRPPKILLAVAGRFAGAQGAAASAFDQLNAKA